MMLKQKEKVRSKNLIIIGPNILRLSSVEEVKSMKGIVVLVTILELTFHFECYCDYIFNFMIL